MIVTASGMETNNEIVVQWYASQGGDSFNVPKTTEMDLVTLLAKGEGTLTPAGESPQAVAAPEVILLSPEKGYQFTAIGGEVTLFTTYNKRLPGIATEKSNLTRAGIPISPAS
jgi:hypothetical protein